MRYWSIFLASTMLVFSLGSYTVEAQPLLELKTQLEEPVATSQAVPPPVLPDATNNNLPPELPTLPTLPAPATTDPAAVIAPVAAPQVAPLAPLAPEEMAPFEPAEEPALPAAPIKSDKDVEIDRMLEELSGNIKADPNANSGTATEKELPDAEIIETPPEMVPEHNFKTQILPETIYKKEYDLENRHLPSSINAADLDHLMFATAGRGDVEALRAILDAGRSVDTKNLYGNTPLITAAVAGHTSAVRLLLARGANPNLQNDLGLTALHAAAHGGYDDMVKALLQKKADPNIATKQDVTPLQFAVTGNHHDIAKVLLDNGARRESRFYSELVQNKTMMETVKGNKVERLRALEEKEEAAKLKKEAAAKVKAQKSTAKAAKKIVSAPIPSEKPKDLEIAKVEADVSEPSVASEAKTPEPVIPTIPSPSAEKDSKEPSPEALPAQAPLATETQAAVTTPEIHEEAPPLPEIDTTSAIPAEKPSIPNENVLLETLKAEDVIKKWMEIDEDFDSYDAIEKEKFNAERKVFLKENEAIIKALPKAEKQKFKASQKKWEEWENASKASVPLPKDNSTVDINLLKEKFLFEMKAREIGALSKGFEQMDTEKRLKMWKDVELLNTDYSKIESTLSEEQKTSWNTEYTRWKTWFESYQAAPPLPASPSVPPLEEIPSMPMPELPEDGEEKLPPMDDSTITSPPPPPPPPSDIPALPELPKLPDIE